MIGQRIRYYRKTKGLTQEELARGICSVSYLSKIENGDAKSSEDVIELLCERLGISPENKQLDVNIVGLLNEWHLLMVTKKYNEAKTTHKKIKQYLSFIEDPKLLIRYDIFLTRQYLVEKKIDEAQKLVKKINQIDNQQFDTTLTFYKNLVNGQYYYLINEYNQSLKCFEEAEPYVLQTPLTQTEIATYYYGLALTHTALFHNTSVINYAYKALTIFDKEYNFNRSCDCQILLGIVNRRINNYSQSVHHFKQAHKFAESFNDQSTLGIIYHNLGLVASNENQSEKAIDYYLKSVNIKEDNKDTSIYLTYYLVAKEYFNLGNLSNAREWVKKMELQLNETDERTLMEEYLLHIQVLKMQVEGKVGKEFETFLKKEVIPFFQKKNIMEYVCENCVLLADYYYKNSQYKSAGEYYKMALEARSQFA